MVKSKTEVFNKDKQEDEEEYKIEIVWRNIFGMIYLHFGAFVGVYYWFTGATAWQTILFGKIKDVSIF